MFAHMQCSDEIGCMDNIGRINEAKAWTVFFGANETYTIKA